MRRGSSMWLAQTQTRGCVCSRACVVRTFCIFLKVETSQNLHQRRRVCGDCRWSVWKRKLWLCHLLEFPFEAAKSAAYFSYGEKPSDCSPVAWLISINLSQNVHEATKTAQIKSDGMSPCIIAKRVRTSLRISTFRRSSHLYDHMFMTFRLQISKHCGLQIRGRMQWFAKCIVWWVVKPSPSWTWADCIVLYVLEFRCFFFSSRIMSKHQTASFPVLSPAHMMGFGMDQQLRSFSFKCALSKSGLNSIK